MARMKIEFGKKYGESDSSWEYTFKKESQNAICIVCKETCLEVIDKYDIWLPKSQISYSEIGIVFDSWIKNKKNLHCENFVLQGNYPSYSKLQKAEAEMIRNFLKGNKKS